MNRPSNPKADNVLVRLIKEQWELSNKDEPSQAYLDCKSMMIKKLRKELEAFGVNEFEYREYAQYLFKKWDEEKIVRCLAGATNSISGFCNHGKG